MPPRPPRIQARLAMLALLLSPAAAAADGGTVSGKVAVSPARFQDETVVYVKTAAPARPATTHTIDQKGMKFLPLVVAAAPGDTVVFLNHDHDEHSVYSADGDAFNLGKFKEGETRRHTFDEPGVYRIQCSIHPEMLAWVFVAPGPYAAVIDRKGRYEIAGVPPGRYALAVWNANAKAPDRQITVEAGKTVEEDFSLRR